MTILPHDRYFSVWERAIARLQAFINAVKYWRGGGVRLPVWWKPRQIERNGSASNG